MNLSTIDADSGISNSQLSTLEEVIKVLNNEPRAERSDANDQNKENATTLTLQRRTSLMALWKP